ncbi:MAG TPA: hypothetical protein VN698_05545, partial [Bacteroidia bacterium]|nr:hypothetical protein [Bacteroidia bacterium]
MKKIILCIGLILSGRVMNAQWSLSAWPNIYNTNPLNVGIGTTAPIFKLHVVGNGVANNEGWSRGILLDKQAALYWNGAPYTNHHFFMAHSSGTPPGDFYQGYSTGFGSTAPVEYTSKVYVTTPPAFIPIGSTQIFKNLLVQQNGFNRSLGVNILNPKRTADFLISNAPQLRLTQTENTNPTLGVYTDFQTTNAGNLNIIPRNGTLAKNVGIDVPTPTQKIDVAGNARLRNVPTASANYLMTGIIQGGVANDIIFSKLAFSGSPTQVLLGNGTWGTLPATVAAANNGLTATSTFVQLGQNCGDTGNLGKLLSNREIPFNGFNIFYPGQGIPTTNAIGVGYSCGTLPAKFNVLQQ